MSATTIRTGQLLRGSQTVSRIKKCNSFPYSVKVEKRDFSRAIWAIPSPWKLAPKLWLVPFTRITRIHNPNPIAASPS